MSFEAICTGVWGFFMPGPSEVSRERLSTHIISGNQTTLEPHISLSHVFALDPPADDDRYQRLIRDEIAYKSCQNFAFFFNDN